MQLTEHSALERLATLGMDDMPVIEYTPNRCVIDNDWFIKYSEIKQILDKLKVQISVKDIPF